MRVFPAYGRAIARCIARGDKPICVAVMLSNGWWNHFNHVPKICIKAEEWQLGRWELSYLRGLNIVAIPGDCTDAQLGELLVDLMSAAPARLWAYDLHGTRLTPEDDFNCDQQTIGFWVHELGAMRISDPRLAKARAIFGRSHAAAESEIYEIAGKVAERGGDALKWHAEQSALLDRMHKLFSSPFQRVGDPVPA